jgi:hypothetical protein
MQGGGLRMLAAADEEDGCAWYSRDARLAAAKMCEHGVLLQPLLCMQHRMQHGLSAAWACSTGGALRGAALEVQQPSCAQHLLSRSCPPPGAGAVQPVRGPRAQP